MQEGIESEARRVPLDVQGREYTGIYPALGPGELLKDKVNSVAMARGRATTISS